MRFSLPWSFLIAGLLAAGIAPAADHAREGEHEETWREHPNHLSVVFAGTYQLGDEGEDEDAETLGIDYEFRLNRLLGLGVVAERAFDPLETTTVLAVADLHVWRGLAIQTGPGLERVDGELGADDEDELVYRVGALYELEKGRFTISPQLHLDLTRETDSLVAAIALGYVF